MADGEVHLKAKFHAMTEGTQEDWQAIHLASRDFNAAYGDRLITAMRELGSDTGGFAVDRLTHSLQTATRAHRDGRDEEYVVCALIHDIGDVLGPTHHADIGAEVLRPYISEDNHWMMQHHAIFQGYYYFHYLGGDRNRRDEYKGHPAYEYTAQFCQLYDQNSFDPAYDSMPLSAFEPLVRRVCAVPKRMTMAPAKSV